MCMYKNKPTLLFSRSASVVSTRLTMLDNSCIVKHQERTPMVGRRGIQTWRVVMYSEGRIRGDHIASLLSVKDCTTVYGDYRGITDDKIVQDACEVHGLICRG